MALTFKPQTLAFRLLSLIAISGELPTVQLSRLANYDYAVKTVNKLKQQGLLYTYQRNGLRVLRLTSRGKLLLLTYDPDRFAASLTGAVDTNHIKTEISRRQRLHRVAETLVTMQNAGVFIHRDEKTDVFAPDWQDAPLSIPAFYHSREIKSLGTDFVKIHNARSVGVLLTDRHIFVVYGLHTATLKWSYSAEMRTKALMKTILCRERLPHRYSPDAVQGLILANDWEPAYTILSDHSGKPHFLLDGSYDHFHFLTHDHRGECLLQLLCNETLTYAAYASRCQAGATLKIDTTWINRAVGRTPHNFEVRFLLVGAEDSAIISAGMNNCSKWIKDHEYAESYSIPISEKLSSGQYALGIGLYDPISDTYIALPMADKMTDPHFYSLGSIEVLK